MKVKVAKVAGFCMGVRRAMDLALEISLSGSSAPVYTYGPLIHNPSALELLRSRGVEVLKDIPEKGTGTVIIRAHGVPPDDRRKLIRAGFTVVDGTCSRVVKVQMLARHYAAKGYRCILIGDQGHPEVIGIMGYAGGNGILVSSEEDIENLPHLEKYIILAQTTQDRERFSRWCQKIQERYPGGRVFNTICDSTHKRQREVRRLAHEVDAVVVVGGKQSANTRRLAEIVEEVGKVSIPVETENDILIDEIKEFKKIGVTAGASTPNWIINRAVRKIEAIPGNGESVGRSALYRLMRFLHESNLWTASAGGAFASALALIEGDPQRVFKAAPLAFFYIFSMHTLNRLIDRESGEYNDPLRVRFLIHHRKLFFVLSFLALAASLSVAFKMGTVPFFFLLALSTLGGIYTIPVIPKGARFRALKDFPGSKTLFVALAWASVAGLVSRMNFHPEKLPLSVWVCFFTSFLLVFARSILMEILDIQGDRIVGRETLAVLIGEKKGLSWVKILSFVIMAISVVFPVAGLTGWHFLAFSFAGLWILWLERRFEEQRLGQNMRLECLVEATFFIFLAAAVMFYSIIG